MHEPSVDTTAPPSTEALPEPTYVSDLFGADIEAGAPNLICEVIDEVTALCSAPPQVVAAVALATLAAAIGPKIVLARGRHRYSPGFNVAISHCCPRGLPWMDAIVAPFTGRVFEMEAALFKQGPAALRDKNARRQNELAQARRTVGPNPDLLAHLEAEARRSDARMNPFVATSDMAPKELAGLLLRAFDGGVTVVAAGNDPGSDFLRLKPAERVHVAQLLNRTWNRTPLAFGSEVHTGGINILWATREAPSHLLDTRGFDPTFLAVPTLVLDDETDGAALPVFASEAKWDETVGHLFDRRCLNREVAFNLHPDAEAVLADFGKHLAAQHTVPTGVRPHISWLPELANRLAIIYWVVAGHEEAGIDADMATAAVEMTKWIGRQHVAAVTSAVPADNADSADNKAKLLAKIRAKAPISRRDLRRTFENQKVKWFDAVLDALLEEKKVRYNDEMLLVAFL